MTWFNRLSSAPQVDWARVLMDLKRAGCTMKSIAADVGVSKSTVVGWRNQGAEPRHRDGERLLSLWVVKTGRPLRQVPAVDGKGCSVEARLSVGVQVVHVLTAKELAFLESQLDLPGLQKA